MSSCGMVPCLSAYSVLVTTILVIISVMYSKTGTVTYQQCDNIGTQEVQGETQTHVDILSVDFSSNEQQIGEKGNCKCETLEWLGFQLFEIIILSLICIGIVYAGFRCTQEGKQWFEKWTEARKSAEERKFEKMRLKYETSTTSRQGAPKIETIELAGYEKGDDFQSDDAKEARTRK